MSSESTRAPSAVENRPRWVGKALRDFDRTARLLSGFLATRYGQREAESLVRDARARYADILPQVPWVKGRRAPVMNAFLSITAQELSVYHAVEARGGGAPEAWEVCHRAIRLRLARVPKWKRWAMNRFLFSTLVRRVVRRREAGLDRRIGDLRNRGRDFPERSLRNA